MNPHPIELLNRGAYVRVYSRAIGCEDLVMAEGRVVWYSQAPTLGIEGPDGRQGAWSTCLRIEEIEPPTNAAQATKTEAVMTDPEIWAKTEGINAKQRLLHWAIKTRDDPGRSDDDQPWVSPIHATSVDPQSGYDGNPLAAEVNRLRAALKACFRAIAFTYGGTPRPPASKPEKRALWDAMHVAGDVLDEKA